MGESILTSLVIIGMAYIAKHYAIRNSKKEYSKNPEMLYKEGITKF